MIRTLRKKLQNYYYNDGKDDKFRLRIPKGHYEAKFVPVSEEYSKKVLKNRNNKNYILIGIIIVLSILLISLWSRNRVIENKLEKDVTS